MTTFDDLFKRLSEDTKRAMVPALQLFLAFEQNYKAKKPADKQAAKQQPQPLVK